ARAARRPSRTRAGLVPVDGGPAARRPAGRGREPGSARALFLRSHDGGIRGRVSLGARTSRCGLNRQQDSAGVLTGADMCGIAGRFNFNAEHRVDQQQLMAMMSVIAHRGPDAGGFYTGDGVGLGHRRLRIIDLSAGDQPLPNEDESIWTVFNGEIYNFAELRVELESFGHRFRTHTDTEVIVHAYEQWGELAMTRFRGMFAFALWDVPRR